MSVVTHLVQEMYEHVDTLNTDIDRLTVLRDRMNAAILALVPPGDELPVQPQRPGIKPAAVWPNEEHAPTPPRNRTTLDVTKPAPKPVRVKHDLTGVATVAMAAFVDGRSMSKAVAAVLDVSEATAFSLLAKARTAGHAIPKKSGGGRKAAGAAITPAEIRHEVEPTPTDRVMSVPEHTNPIVDGAIGWANRPTHVEHPPVETERHGWSPGMGAEVLAAAVAS